MTLIFKYLQRYAFYFNTNAFSVEIKSPDGGATQIGSADKKR